MSFVSLEECELYGDAKYRTYVAAVDKALKNFEYSSEWPDLISALGKLNKVILSYAKYKVIPRRLLISKRLAQCMHPSLPSGVHLKALETYDILFKCIGRERLAEELFIYSSGLFPLFGLAAMTVRPYLLSLYEAHLVPLGANLQPALSGFLTGVLAGLDETSDYYQRTVAMLERVCSSVNPSAFYGSVWKCVDENALVRLPAINLILGRYDRKLSMEDQLFLLGPDLDLVVSAFSACFREGAVLVQRSALDLLVAGFPLHEPPLGKDDTMTVATAALCVVLRRDVSLNRRLFSWLLGSEVHASSLASDHPLAKLLSSTSSVESSVKTNDSSSSVASSATVVAGASTPYVASSDQVPSVVSPYFATYGKNAVVTALKRWLSKANTCPSSDGSSVSTCLEAFRIVAAILEKPEIGACVVDDVFLDVLRALYHEGRRNDAQGKARSGSGQGDSNERDKGKANDDNYPSERRQGSAGDGRRIAGAKNWTQDFLKLANLVFGVLEADHVWNQCKDLFTDAVRGKIAVDATCKRLDASFNDYDSCSRGGEEEDGFEGRSECPWEQNVVHAVGSSSKHNRVSEICELVCFLLDLLAFQSGPGTNGSVGELLLDLMSSVLSLLSSHHSWLSSREVTDTLDMCECVLAQIQPSVLGSDLCCEGNPSTRRKKDEREDEDDLKGTEKRSTVSTVTLCGKGEGRDEREDEDTADDEGSRISTCVKDFVNFFSSFVARNIFAGEAEVDRLFDALCAKSSDGMGKLGRLERLLRSALDLDRSVSMTSTSSSSTNTMTTAASSFQAWREEDRLDLVGTRKRVIEILISSKAGISAQVLSRWTPAFKACCRLLVQFSSFPTYVSMSALVRAQSMTPSPSRTKLKRLKSDQPANAASVPKWLRALVCCAAFLQSAEFPIHAAAVEAIVDLACLLITCLEVEKNLGGSSSARSNASWSCLATSSGSVAVGIGPCNATTMGTGEGEDTVSVVIRPLMKEPEFRVLMVDTHITQVLAHLLWSHVDCAGSPQTVDSVSLLQRMFTVLPSRESVQNCLCETLADPNTTERAVAAQRFAVYWHYTRELQKRTPSSGLRNLERCVLLMLENLGSDSSVLKSCSEGWLMHSLHQGDVARLFDPIFLILLDPGSARTSIQRYLEVVVRDEQRRRAKSYQRGEDGKVQPEDDENDDDDEESMITCREVDETDSDLASDGDASRTRLEMKKSRSMPILENHGDADAVVEGIVDELITRVVSDASPPPRNDAPTTVTAAAPVSSGETKWVKTHRRQRSQSFSFIESVRSPSPASMFSEDPVKSVASRFGSISGTHALDGSAQKRFGSHLLDAAPTVGSIDRSPFEDPLHSFLLVYSDVPDLAQVKYALSLMHSAVMTHPSSVLRSLVSTNLSSAHTPRASELQNLLARHKRSIRGLPFTGKMGPEETSCQRGITLMEILLQCCLNFLRSCCPLQRDSTDVTWNAEVRLAAVDLLSISFLELMEMVKINGRGFASFIADLLSRCKVQKVVLRSLASSVQRVKNRLLTPDEGEALGDEEGGEIGEDVARAGEPKAGSTAEALSEMLLEFNEGGVDIDIGGVGGTGRSFPEALQIHLLRLLHALIILENTLGDVQQQFRSPTRQKSADDVSHGSNTHQQFARITFVAPTGSLRYMVGQPIPAQSIFLHSVLTVLRQEKLRHLHGFWLATINASLPYFGKTLSQIAVLLARQICFNLESVQGVVTEKEEERISRWRQIPPDYVVRLLESLSTLCHYCLLESPVARPSLSVSSMPHSTLSSSTASAGGSHIQSYAASLFSGVPSARYNPVLLPPQPSSKTSTLGNTTQIINNLINVFIPSVPVKAIDAGGESRSAADALLLARKALAGVLPRIITAMAGLWKSAIEIGDEYSWVLGHPRDVKNHVIDFVSPIAVSQGTNFMLSIAVAWQESRRRGERRSPGGPKRSSSSLPSPSKNDDNIAERWGSVASGSNVNQDQERLVTLVSAIKSLPPDKIVQMVTQLVGQGYGVLPATRMLGGPSSSSASVSSIGPASGGSSFNASLTVNHARGENPLLEFFRCYVERCSAHQLIECWPSLSSLVREALAVAANTGSSSVEPLSVASIAASSTVSHVFCILWAFVQKVSVLPERKDQKELQDLSVRVLDHLGHMAGICLEQTAWLRPRTVIVKPGMDAVNAVASGDEEEHVVGHEIPPVGVVHTSSSMPDLNVGLEGSEKSSGPTGLEAETKLVETPGNVLADMVIAGNEEAKRALTKRRIIREAERAIADQCLGALTLLGECVASFLDVLYASDEKERVVPILTSLLSNVTPYLRNHSRANMARHRACAKLLSAVSSFPYARKAWKKDALELLLDPAFFHMDLPSLRHWKSLLDNLVAQEKLIFKDLLNRFPVGTSGSLSLFSSREAEAEQRTLLLKRIAFLLFCSDSDQYQQFMPNLQEKLGECLRWASASANAGPGPAVQAAVFLCFRVLLLRASSPHLSALWPTIITELLQILLQIEQDLSTDSEEFSSHLKRLSTLETTFVTSNGLQAHNNPAWLNLYLSASKLLDLALALPANRLPQFQMYAWAFIGSPEHVEPTMSSLPRATSSSASLVNGDLSSPSSSIAATASVGDPRRVSSNRSIAGSQKSHAASDGDLAGDCGFVTIDADDSEGGGGEDLDDEEHAVEAERWQEESSKSDASSTRSSGTTASTKSMASTTTSTAAPADNEKTRKNGRKTKDVRFLPHMARIAKLMRLKFGRGKNGTLFPKLTQREVVQESQLLLTMTSIKSLSELAPFFDTWGGPGRQAAVMARHVRHRGGVACLTPNLVPRDGTGSPAPSSVSSSYFSLSGSRVGAGELSDDPLVREIEKALEADFLEKLVF